MFNLSLLAWQAWRILNKPSSLSARVLKAAYYPSVDFLEADLGTGPSRVWPAIIEGKEVLVQGIIRRIGMGETTNLWSMNWLLLLGINLTKLSTDLTRITNPTVDHS